MNGLKSFAKSENQVFNFFYLMTVGVLLAWVMVAGIVDTTIFVRAHETNLVRVFFVVLLFGLIFSHKIVARIAFVSFAIFALYLSWGFVSVAFFPESTSNSFALATTLLNTLQYIIGLRQHTHQYENIIVWLLIVCFSFVVTYCSYVRFRFWLLLALSTTTASIAITSPYFRDYRIFYVFTFCLLMLVVIKMQQLNQNKISHLTPTASTSKLFILLVAVVVMVANIFPTPEVGEEGLFRQFISSPFRFINDVFADLTSPTEFSLSNVGFGSSDRLGGDVVLNDRPFMRLTGRFQTPLYLTGATSDTYTGYSWTRARAEYHELDFTSFAHQIELTERFLADSLIRYTSLSAMIHANQIVRDLRLEDHPDFGHFILFMDEETGFIFPAFSLDDGLLGISTTNSFGQHTVYVDTLNHRLTNLFHVGSVFDVFLNNPDITFLRNREGRIIASERLERETIYRVRYHDFNQRLPLLSRIELPDILNRNNPLQHSYRGVLNDILLTIQTFQANHGYTLVNYGVVGTDGMTISYADFLENYLIPRSELIHEIYLQLPEALPNRIQELAEHVTATGQTNFERMLLLEAFLNDNFTYTLTPGVSPTDQDFVDHFLFELQQGYCVHFATAFVVMARTLGMPSRYVEGFMVSAPRGHHSHPIYVLNNMAHAWAEVYFEGYGWVRFEPTPGGGATLGSTPNLPVDWSPDTDIDWGIFDPELAERDLLEAEGEITPGQGGNSGQTVNEIEEVNYSPQRLPLVVWLGMAVVAGGLLLLLRIKCVQYQKNQQNKGDNHVLMNYRYRQLLVYLRLLGYKMQPHETEIAFMKQIKNQLHLPIHEQDMLVDTAQIYTHGRYSLAVEITDAQLETFEQLTTRLDARLITHIGKIRYYLYRNLIGKF